MTSPRSDVRRRRSVPRTTPWRWWRWRARAPKIAGAVAGVLALLALAARVDDAELQHRRWGETRVVPVLIGALDTGEQVRSDLVEWRALPVAALADAPVAALDRPTAALTPMAAGEVVFAHRVAPDARSGVAARIEPGHRGVAIGRHDDSVEVRLGDHVDLVAGGDAWVSSREVAMVVEGVEVVAVDDQSITVAVPADAVGRVAAALGTSRITLALRGADGPPPLSRDR